MTEQAQIDSPNDTRSPARNGRIAWITGGRGFLGGAVGRQLSAAGWRCVSLGHGVTSFDETPCFSGSVDTALLAQAAGFGLPDLVFHGGGGASVAKAQSDPAMDFRLSVLSTADLVHFLGQHAPEAHLIYPSSVAVYGAQPKGAISEDVPPQPVSHYGWHKLAAETLCRQGNALYGLRMTIIRFFSLFGPGLRKQLLWDIAKRALNGEAMIFSGSGDETRDFLHIDDAAALISQLSESDHAGCRIVNGGSGRAVTVRHVVELMLAALDITGVTPEFSGEIRVGDPRHYQADVTCLSGLGFEPKYTLESAIADYAGWAASILQATPSPNAAEERRNVAV